MLVTIDYLILNFKGSLSAQKFGLQIYSEDSPNPFELVLHQYGNKTFSEVYDLYYCKQKIAVVNAVPRSNIIASDLIQIQFENYLFYTNTLNDLGQLVYELVDYFALVFEGVNRLDIAIDTKENRIKYKELYFDLLSGKKLLKGREKNISAHSITKKGNAQFNGFTIGKRSSSRFLRIYNKTENLKIDDSKSYINDYHKKNGLIPSAGLDVWRYEYQLNSSFFTYLRKYEKNITFSLFDIETLLDLVYRAHKNHFEVVYNTGKTETNKERPFSVICFDSLFALVRKSGYYVTKLKRIFSPSITIQKRLLKSLFRQYYIKQKYNYLQALSEVLNEYHLKKWFLDKTDFYLSEFKNKERLKSDFSMNEFLFKLNLSANV